jgi:hypothetical protein
MDGGEMEFHFFLFGIFHKAHSKFLSWHFKAKNSASELQKDAIVRERGFG